MGKLIGSFLATLSHETGPSLQRVEIGYVKVHVCVCRLYKDAIKFALER
jgi:hypothetical protein